MIALISELVNTVLNASVVFISGSLIQTGSNYRNWIEFAKFSTKPTRTNKGGIHLGISIYLTF